MTTEFKYELVSMNLEELMELKRLVEEKIALINERDRLVKLLKGE